MDQARRFESLGCVEALTMPVVDTMVSVEPACDDDDDEAEEEDEEEADGGTTGASDGAGTGAGAGAGAGAEAQVDTDPLAEWRRIFKVANCQLPTKVLLC